MICLACFHCALMDGSDSRDPLSPPAPPKRSRASISSIHSSVQLTSQTQPLIARCRHGCTVLVVLVWRVPTWM